jgi:hypothetical protein
MTLYFPLGARSGEFTYNSACGGGPVQCVDGVFSGTVKGQHLCTFESPLAVAHILVTHGPMLHLARVTIVDAEFDFRFYIAGGCQERTTAVRLHSWVPADQWPVLMTGELRLPRGRMWFKAGKRHRAGGLPAVITTFTREWRLHGSLVVAAKEEADGEWRYSVSPSAALRALRRCLPLLDVDGSPLQLPPDQLAALDALFRPGNRLAACRLWGTSASLPAVLDYI